MMSKWMDDEVKGRKLSIMNRRRRSSVLQPVGENVADFSFTHKREDDIQEINEKAVTKMGEMGTKSPWLSLWICNFVQFLCGIQFAIYFTSMWPYLSKVCFFFK
ncbi:hypothetical protein AB6A40_007372 [Gnathostoma spinigerum]|uniref:Transmembrane protein n=1 Tax=Gnathostoma spinigerum TaxID=75299 RepID=A0ABD6EL11_9BILA